MAEKTEAQMQAEALAAQIKSQMKPEEQATPKQMADTNLQRCPCCGWNLENRNVPQPGEDDRQEYLRCLLGKRRFTKGYVLFKGALAVKMELLSPEQASTLGVYLKDIPRTDAVAMTTEVLQLKLLFYLRQINEVSYTPPGPGVDWRKVYLDTFKEYGEDVPIILSRVMLEFLRLAEMLPQSGFDANFWKSAGLS